ncbi:MAG: TldD/PmbA family protein [Leptospirales bacterium]
MIERSVNDLLSYVVDRAKFHGASSAEALFISSDDLSVAVRKGEVEKVNRVRSRGMGLRVFRGKSQAVVSTSDLDRGSLDGLIKEAVQLAMETAPDPHNGLPAFRTAASPDVSKLEIDEGHSPEISQEERIRMALESEDAAFGEDPRIRNSEGAEFQTGVTSRALVNTEGFSGSYARTSYAMSCSVIAQDGDSMERDYWYEQSHHLGGLPKPSEVGRHAARRALSRLHPTRPVTKTCPVLFDAEVARSLISHLVGALSGYSLYRNSTYLKGREGTAVASPLVNIREEPLYPGGFGTRPFDGEGVVSSPKALVEKGVLQTFLFDVYSARKMGRDTTGNAVRSLGDVPQVGVSNVFVDPGTKSKDELIRSIGSGLYVTELIGFGVNTVTGDYSRGAFGYWIENGEITGPVSELTIAGTLDEIFQRIVEVGSDFRLRSSISSPSLLVESMRVGGT